MKLLSKKSLDVIKSYFNALPETTVNPYLLTEKENELVKKIALRSRGSYENIALGVHQCKIRGFVTKEDCAYFLFYCGIFPNDVEDLSSILNMGKPNIERLLRG